MDKITWENGTTELSKSTMDTFQNNIANAISGTIVPDGNKTRNLGSSDKKYYKLFVNEIIYGEHAISFDWSGSKVQIYVDGTLVREL